MSSALWLRRGLALVSVAVCCAASGVARAGATPETAIVFGPEDGSFINDTTPAFVFVADRPATFSCVLDGPFDFPCSSPLELGPLADGPHALSVAAVSNGARDHSPAQRRFVVDTVPPQTAFTAGPADGATLDYNTPQFAWEGIDAVAFACELDGRPVSSCASALDEPLADGPHSFSVAAIDLAGNVDPTPALRRFTVAADFGSDPPGCRHDGNVVVETNRRDVRNGGRGTDIIFGRRGNDVLRGRGGHDCLYGGPGNDRLDGGPGNDRLSGSSGADRLTDRSGRDTFYGGSGNDRIDARDRTAAGRRQRDVVSCGSGRRDIAYVDRRDRVASDCERVRRRKR